MSRHLGVERLWLGLAAGLRVRRQPTLAEGFQCWDARACGLGGEAVWEEGDGGKGKGGAGAKASASRMAALPSPPHPGPPTHTPPRIVPRSARPLALTTSSALALTEKVTRNGLSDRLATPGGTR